MLRWCRLIVPLFFHRLSSSFFFSTPPSLTTFPFLLHALRFSFPRVPRCLAGWLAGLMRCRLVGWVALWIAAVVGWLSGWLPKYIFHPVPLPSSVYSCCLHVLLFVSPSVCLSLFLTRSLSLWLSLLFLSIPSLWISTVLGGLLGSWLIGDWVADCFGRCLPLSSSPIVNLPLLLPFFISPSLSPRNCHFKLLSLISFLSAPIPRHLLFLSPPFFLPLQAWLIG